MEKSDLEKIKKALESGDVSLDSDELNCALEELDEIMKMTEMDWDLFVNWRVTI